MLASGGLVIGPTETRYGMLVRGDSRAALEYLSRIKGRPATMPVSIFARDRAELERSGEITAVGGRIIERFLPGPVTLVVKAKGLWEPQIVLNERIGLRWSSSPVIAELLHLIDVPLTATSANRSGEPDAETIGELAASFGDQVHLYLDAGPLKGITSTVVDCTGGLPVILREGAISRERLLDAVKDLLSE